MVLSPAVLLCLLECQCLSSFSCQMKSLQHTFKVLAVCEQGLRSLQCVMPQVMSSNEWVLSAACRDACELFVYAMLFVICFKDVV